MIAFYNGINKWDCCFQQKASPVVRSRFPKLIGRFERKSVCPTKNRLYDWLIATFRGKFPVRINTNLEICSVYFITICCGINTGKGLIRASLDPQRTIIGVLVQTTV